MATCPSYYGAHTALARAHHAIFRRSHSAMELWSLFRPHICMAVRKSRCGQLFFYARTKISKYQPAGHIYMDMLCALESPVRSIKIRLDLRNCRWCRWGGPSQLRWLQFIFHFFAASKWDVLPRDLGPRGDTWPWLCQANALAEVESNSSKPDEMCAVLLWTSVVIINLFIVVTGGRKQRAKKSTFFIFRRLCLHSQDERYGDNMKSIHLRTNRTGFFLNPRSTGRNLRVSSSPNGNRWAAWLAYERNVCHLIKHILSMNVSEKS